MRDIQFALVREGVSDDGLATPIRRLLVRAGAPGVIGAARHYRGTTKAKLMQVLAESPVPDVIFVHRDSDARDPTDRHAEIGTAASELYLLDKVVAVVPVQETEAWLLTDESMIRAVVGRPSGKVPLRLPTISRIEATTDPKQILKTACEVACEKRGARLKAASLQFSQYRANLLERLDVDGPVNQLSSWKRFVDDLNAAATRVISQMSGPELGDDGFPRD